MKDYDMAIEKNLNNSSAYYNRGNLKNDLGDKEGAMKDYDMAIKKNLNFSEAYNNRGNLKKDSGDITGAIKDFSSTISIDNKKAKAYVNRAECYRILAEQNPDEHAQWIAKAEADEEKAASLKKKG
jgi:tetratricopeptide (TPR) repeat protein